MYIQKGAQYQLRENSNNDTRMQRTPLDTVLICQCNISILSRIYIILGEFRNAAARTKALDLDRDR